MAHWEDVAYSLHYDIPTVEGIDTKQKSDPKKYIASSCLRIGWEYKEAVNYLTS